MREDMELYQVIYNVLLTQIRFDARRLGDNFPTLENAGSLFMVSVDTVRSAYLRLQEEGYITLTKNVGSTVTADYSDQEIEGYIREFFSQRKNALLDLCVSLRPLLGHAQYVGLKHADAASLQAMKRLTPGSIPAPFLALHHMKLAYAALGNELLTRLVWQIYMFFDAPFFSICENQKYFEPIAEYTSRMAMLSMRRDWTLLQSSVTASQDSLYAALRYFYETRIPRREAESEILFTWSAYKKTSQLCYSLAMDLLVSINRGEYPDGSLLPSLNKLSKEKNVSVSTVRRALSLLSAVGATKSLKRIGTRVLPYNPSSANCDLTKPAVRKRLLDAAQSLQLLTLSCKAVAEATIPSLDSVTIEKCKARLRRIQDMKQYTLIPYAALELLAWFAPYQTVRMIYKELMQLLFWGYPLRTVEESPGELKLYYTDYLETFTACLENGDAVTFSDRLEELMRHEFRIVMEKLRLLDVQEAERLLIP